MIRPRRTRPVRQRMSQQAIAWAVLPSPMSSASSKSARRQEPLDPLALIGVELALHVLEAPSRSRLRSRHCSTKRLEPHALALEQACAMRGHDEISLHSDLASS